MKRILIPTAFLLIAFICFGQENVPKEVTPPEEQKMKADIEKEIPVYKQKLVKQDLTAVQIEFSLDTFRIEQLAAKLMEIDYSTVGMNEAVEDMTSSYDRLMNKYYNQLLKALKPGDQKVLINAQRAWLAYRDAESKLIGTMTKDEYSGGGTMQSNIAVGSYADLVVKRTIDIFGYYEGMSDNQ